MKERQRWRSEEDAILRAYVKRYGAKEWNLVSQRMNVPLQRDAKSCLERWKNYLKPGIKKGSLTEEEQRLVIHLQSKHGNKWKKIAAEVPGRTAKRLGKWWEVFKEKQNRESSKENTNSSSSDPIQSGKYDLILESFAEKLVNQRPLAPLLMAAPLLPLPLPLPPPSVALTLSQSATDHPFWMTTGLLPPFHHPMAEVVECCREVQEGHRAWAAQRKEAAWRLKRVELQIEAEKACKRKEVMEEMESKVREVMEEQRVELERIDAEYRERMLGIWRDAEDEEKKVVEIWEAKHGELRRLMEKKMTSRH